ncbi:hypothetical protein F5144DRAFT_586356 [Chaetomium tenue]|uniref:Uncharacterized protein n=1 Tax=Chaetomium tenue TaxID=1854479 RepID=A0ACB7NZN1_9PEZI|nr:hypothetical protein F5144DRAFT_586356 [Chaetomium globosum]
MKKRLFNNYPPSPPNTMRSLGATFNRTGWRRYAPIALVAVTVVVVLYTWFDVSSMVPWRPHLPNLQTFPVAPLAKACDNIPPPDPNTPTTDTANAPIPNLVHYIWLLADPAVFTLNFKVFVSVYSAHLFFHPEHIYIHTDVSPSLWERAKSSGDLWTKRVLNIPAVTPQFITNPQLTTTGQPIDTFGAKSDFIRAWALREHGGIYLDVDAVPLRDIKPLRNAGFANVVGGAVALHTKYTGFVNTGVWLARPHSALAEVFAAAMDAFYNGVWAISVDILTDLAFRLQAMPGEVLVVHPRAFAPTSWEAEDQVRLFGEHAVSGGLVAGGGGDVRLPKELGNTCKDALAWLREREMPGGRLESWEMDFSATYVLHAFDDDWKGEISLDYVLARRSNYARAVYPAVWHAVKQGIISEAA